MAALLYLPVTLWTLRVLLPSPGTTTPLPVGASPNIIGDADQAVMIWTTVRNARTFVTRPWRLHDFETCYPTPRAAGFGAPYFTDGLMAIPAYLLGANPILTFNSVVFQALWLSALSMFVLADYWTRDFSAALLAGIAFGFHPSRIHIVFWPHVHGNQWTPLVLLFTHRLFAAGTWPVAAGLALFVGLQILGCFYQLLPFVVLGGAYALMLAVRYRHRLASLAPKLVLVTVVSVACAAVQFSAHLHVQRVWSTLGGRASFWEPITDFYPGNPSSPGNVVLALMLVALVDRVRRRRGVDDPRLPVLVAGLFTLWTLVRPVPVPFTRYSVPNLLALVGSAIPGLSNALGAVRAIQFGRMAVYLPCALLAAYGVAALSRRGRPMSLAVGGVLVGMVLAEIFVPALAVQSFSGTVELEAHERMPRADVVALERDRLVGAVLDLPVGEGLTALWPSSHALLLAAFHHHPIASCYNSFPSPLSLEVGELSRRLPNPLAADDLHALGFETVVVHGDLLGDLTPAVLGPLRGPAASSRFVPVAAGAGHWVFRLRSPAGVVADFGLLAAPVDAPPQAAMPPSAEVAFDFRNPSDATYRHPDPIEPGLVVVRWQDPSGALVAEEQVRTLLPVALAAGEQKTRRVRVSIPASPGTYRVTLARAAEPERVLAASQVEVGAATAQENRRGSSRNISLDGGHGSLLAR